MAISLKAYTSEKETQFDQQSLKRKTEKETLLGLKNLICSDR